MELVCKAAVYHQLLDAGKSTRVGSFGVDEAAQLRNELSCLCKDAQEKMRGSTSIWLPASVWINK